LHVLITGGGGVLGAHLAEELANRGHEVALFDVTYEKDRFVTPFKQLWGDISNARDLEQLPPNADIVVHCAAI